MTKVTLWADKSELITVYQAVFAFQRDLEKLNWAKNKLIIWISRSSGKDEDVVYISSTHALLTAFLAEESNMDSVLVYQSYATSIIQFCNSLTRRSTDFGNTKSIKKLAQAQLCPQWIIDCRHSLCHSSHNQPSMEMLTNAAKFAIDWLKQNFWDKLLERLNSSKKIAIEEIFKIDLSKKSNKNLILEMLKQNKHCFVSTFANHICDKVKLNEDDKRLPKAYCKTFSQLFAIINIGNALVPLLHTLIQLLLDELRNRVASLWFRAIIDGMKSENPQTKFEKALSTQKRLKSIRKFEWLQLFYHALKVPNSFTVEVLEILFPMLKDVIDDNKTQKLKKLLNIYLPSGNDFMVDLSSPVKTIGSFTSLEKIGKDQTCEGISEAVLAASSNLHEIVAALGLSLICSTICSLVFLFVIGAAVVDNILLDRLSLKEVKAKLWY